MGIVLGFYSRSRSIVSKEYSVLRENANKQIIHHRINAIM